MRQMQIRARTLQPGGTLVHDVFAPEDAPWRASAEFFLVPLAGDEWFSDMGNENYYLDFCSDVAKKPTDNFAIIESALEYYSEQSDGARAHQALAALDRLCQDFADRNAEMLRAVRDATHKEAR